jgi:hypothetical protein
MPGIYGPPPRPRPAATPDAPVRPESTARKTLKWIGMLILFIWACALWGWLELEQGSETLDELDRIQQRIDQLSRQPIPRFDVPLKLEPLQFEPMQPLQTAEIIPASSIRPAEARPSLETATLIQR